MSKNLIDQLDAEAPVSVATDTGEEYRRANDLDGKDWTRYSISIWNDVRWTKEESQLHHPAMFPTMLIERLIRCFTNHTETQILDPFMGSGSTLVAAKNQGRQGIGFDIYEKYADLARQRLSQMHLYSGDIPEAVIHLADARRMGLYLEPRSIDFCVTSPPYWDILTQKRSADYKDTRNYGDSTDDLGLIESYEQFLGELVEVFRGVHTALKPGKYCIVNVMDLRKKSTFFPLHSDLSTRMQQIGFALDDIIIWDRRHEYNNLRCLGFPYVFRVNKIHEYLLIFQKPKGHVLET